MEKQRTRTRVRCLVDELPEEVRRDVDDMLADTSNSYVAISAALAQQGYSISKSSIGRYAQRSGKAKIRLNEIREMAHAYVHLLKEDQEIDIARVLSVFYMQRLMNRVMEAGEDEFDEISLEKAGNLLSTLMRSSAYAARYSAGRKDDLEEAKELILHQVRTELADDPEVMAQLQARIMDATATQGGDAP